MLSSKILKNHIENFNRNDNELYINTISNVEAFDFLAENIPLFECPDPDLEEIYYFRWWTFRKHLRSTSDGYVITEFLPDVCWAGKHNSISCASSHHFYEGRWLKERQYLNDYAMFWFRKGGNPRSYGSWIADSIYAQFLVSGDLTISRELLPDLIENIRRWETGWEPSCKWEFSMSRLDTSGLYWQVDTGEGMEFSIGGAGCRPSVNSYLYGDMKAIAEIARFSGKDSIADDFTKRANQLKQLVQEKLWDPGAEFFKTWVNEEGAKPHYDWQDFAPHIYQAGEMVDVRELIGYTPWYFNLPDPGYEKAWLQLIDEDGFKAPFGPTTAERRHPHFMYEHSHDCLWNGESWPFATTQTLVAAANLLNNYQQDYFTREDYFELLQTYTRSHHRTLDNGKTIPWIDENLNPFTGEWIARSKHLERAAKGEKMIIERGKDYNHSGYCDLVISGLIGIRPQAGNTIVVNPLLPEDTWDYFCLDQITYHDRKLTVIWDRIGEKYQQGKGLTVLIDGKVAANSPNMSKIELSL